MKSRTLLLSLSCLLSVSFAKAQTKFSLGGYGRAIVTDNNLSGNILDKTDVNGAYKDTLTQNKGVSGYFLFDLTTDLKVNDDFKANAILRVKSPFGAFFGDRVQFQFRQLQLSGRIAKRVNYELGDINVSLTPYTVYNPEEMWHTYEAEVFKQRRTIQRYENFNFGNAWRLQGAQANTLIKVNKVIDGVGLKAFAVRTSSSNAISTADRVLAGGRAELIKNNFITVGGNYTGLLDIPISVVPNYLTNHVLTGDVNFKRENEALLFKLMLEGGSSIYNYGPKKESKVTYNDYFYDVNARLGVKAIKAEVYVGYKNVGVQFNSPSAQTARLNVDTTSQLFTKVNNGQDKRSLILYDRFTQENIYNQTIATRLYSFRPQYGNLDPYGPATPNRTGFTVGLATDSSIKIIYADVAAKVFKEVVGEGTTELRNFTQLKGGLVFNIGELISSQRLLTVSAGARYENTTRGGKAKVDFNSTLIDLGTSLEVFKKVDLLVGLKLLNGKGTEFQAVRDNNNIINPNIPINSYNYEGSENVYSAGVRLRFAEKSFFTVNYYYSSLKNKLNDTQSYNIGQLFMNYTIQL